MADNVTFTLNADSTPPNGTVAATDELADGSHAGIAKLAISADGSRTFIPATAADGLLVNLGTNNDVTVTGSVTTGGLTDAELRATAVPVDGSGVTQPVSNAGLTALNGAIAGTEVQVDVLTLPALPAGTNNIGDVDVASLPALPAGTNNIGDVDIASLPNEGQQTMANSISVAIASNQSSLPTTEARAATGTQTSVADNAASVTLISANAARIKVTITNDSSARLYVLFNASAASTTAYGVSLAQFETWEELNYTGEIRGIWATDPGDGAARITEFTA